MMNRAVLLLLAIGVTPVMHANAEEAAEAPPGQAAGPWSGKAALGYLATSGNTSGASSPAACAFHSADALAGY